MAEEKGLTMELHFLRKRAEQLLKSINQLSRNLSAEQGLLRQVIEGYSAKRIGLLKQELRARGMTWCTYCSAVIPENEAELLLVEGREKYSHGYENAFYGFQGFSKLHRACQACRELAANKHGQKGEYDGQAKDQSSFCAFRVEKREDGYYARKFGNWMKLDDENHLLDEPSSRLVDKLAEEWNLPMEIEIVSGLPSSGMFVIRERAAMAEVI